MDAWEVDWGGMHGGGGKLEEVEWGRCIGTIQRLGDGGGGQKGSGGSGT